MDMDATRRTIEKQAAARYANSWGGSKIVETRLAMWFPMRSWKAREVIKPPLLSPSEAARAYRSARADILEGN